MALRASIGADFTEFTTAIKNVEIKIKEVGGSASKIERDFNAMVASMRGDRIKQQADIVAAAFEKMGEKGFTAANLTETEQRKVNKIMEEAIAKSRAMGEAVPKAYQDIANATKQAATATDSWGASVTKHATGYLAGMATFATVQRVLGGTVDFLKESVQAAAEAEAASNRLATAMRQNGVATEGNRKAFADLAAEMQRTTVYEDDQIVALEAMATQLGVLPSQMDGAVKAAANLASGLGIDLEKAMTMIVKANNESYTAFGKLGISIDEARAKAEGLPYVLEQINAGLGGQAAAEVETYAGKVAQLAVAWGNLKEAIGTAVITVATAGDGFTPVIALIRGMTDVFNGAEHSWLKLAFASRNGVAGILDGLRDIGTHTKTWKEIEEGLTKVGTAALSTTTRGLKPLALSLEDVRKTEADLAKGAQKVWTDRERAAKQAADGFAKLQAEIYDIEKIGAGATLEVWKFGRAIDEAGDTAATVKALDDMAKKLYEIEKIGAGADFQPWKFGWEIDEAGDAKRKIEELGKASAESWGAGFASIAKGFPDLIVAAFTGTGSWQDALGALGSQIGSLIGDKVGASLGKSIGGRLGSVVASLLPGVGSLLGPVVDKFWGWATKAEGRKVNDLRDAYISAAGGLDALNRKAHDAGLTLDQLLRADTVEEYEAAIAKLNTALARTAQLQGELAGLQQQLAGRQVMDWEKANALIEKYGGTLGNLGKAFTDAKTAANWKSIWDDWQTLIDMGADVGGVLVSMKDEISALVQESRRVGTEIPEQFRPLIEELIRTGQLLDANGDAITDIGQLKFGAPLVSEVDKIIAKIDELIEALTVGLTGAFETVGNTRIAPIKIPYEFDPQNVLPGGQHLLAGESSGVGVPGYAGGTGGFRDFGTGTLAMLHGYEAVVPRGQAAPGGGGALAITITPKIYLDGRELAANQTPYVARLLPNELLLAGN